MYSVMIVDKRKQMYTIYRDYFLATVSVRNHFIL